MTHNRPKKCQNIPVILSLMVSLAFILPENEKITALNKNSTVKIT